jgi:hypothetical protein
MLVYSLVIETSLALGGGIPPMVLARREMASMVITGL